MPWSLFFECWVSSQIFHSLLSPSRGSFVPLHFLPLGWCHLHIWGYWYIKWEFLAKNHFWLSISFFENEWSSQLFDVSSWSWGSYPVNFDTCSPDWNSWFNHSIFLYSDFFITGLPWWLRGQSLCLQCRRPGSDPWVRKIPWRRKWQPTLVLLPGKFHGQRSLVGYNLWGRKELDMTEWFHFLPFITESFFCGLAGKESAYYEGDLGSIHGLGGFLGEGRGYPLQYSGLENSMDCIVHGVAESDMTQWPSLSLLKNSGQPESDWLEVGREVLKMALYSQGSKAFILGEHLLRRRQ